VALDPHPQAVALARRNAAALGLGEAQYRVVQGPIEEAATMYVCIYVCMCMSDHHSI
jgi:methylase of polypeptide subunit release factors